MGVRRAACTLLFAATACGRANFDPVDEVDFEDLEPAMFATPEDAQVWASMSAPGLMVIALMPLILADANVSVSGETCPVKTIDSATTTMTGGCTDSMGRIWMGTAVAVEESANNGSYIYDGFGYYGAEGCEGVMSPTLLMINGSLTMTTSGTLTRFEIDLAETTTAASQTDCTASVDRVAVRYSGTVVPTGIDADADGTLDDSLYNGSGMVGTERLGAAVATTRDELISAALCGDEAASGTTTFDAGGHRMVVTYDGATDCDADSTVTWTFDGVDQGELTGITCSAGRSSPFTLIWIVGAVWAMRRRRLS